MIVVTGGKGFVGTNLCEALDTAQIAYRIIELGDELDLDGATAVIHLAANADVRYGWEQPRRDLEMNVGNTVSLLAKMRHHGVRRLLFASSSAVYGNAPTPTPETYTGQQTSLYGASKLAGEAFIGAYCAAGHISATILRMTSMLGPHYRHGLVKDFVWQAMTKGEITVLGGGKVPRTRMHVADAINAFLARLGHDPGYEVFNVSRPDTITSLEVAEIVAQMCDAHITDVVEESWVGDHPILLNASKLRMTGWTPTYTIEESVRETVNWLLR